MSCCGPQTARDRGGLGALPLAPSKPIPLLLMPIHTIVSQMYIKLTKKISKMHSIIKFLV